MASRVRWIDVHPIREDGRLGTRIVVGEEALGAARAEVALEGALALVGAWNDLDFDEMMHILDLMPVGSSSQSR